MANIVPRTFQICQKHVKIVKTYLDMSKSYPSHAQHIFKSCPNHTKIIQTIPKASPISSQKQIQIIPKSSPNDPQSIHESSPNHLQIMPKYSQNHLHIRVDTCIYVYNMYVHVHTCYMCTRTPGQRNGCIPIHGIRRRTRYWLVVVLARDLDQGSSAWCLVLSQG